MMTRYFVTHSFNPLDMKRNTNAIKAQRTLKPITAKQIKWIEDKTFHKLYEEYCEGRMHHLSRGYYFYCIITSHKGYTVTRHIVIDAQYCRRTGFKVHRLQEVAQHFWGDTYSDLNVFQVKKLPFWYNMRICYSHDEPHYKGCGTPNCRNRIDVFNYYDEDVYPIRRMASKNLSATLLYEFDCLDLRDIMKNTEHPYNGYVETIARSEPKLLVSLAGHREKFHTGTGMAKVLKDFFPSYRICKRNGYTPNDWGIWADLIKQLRTLGLDTHNAHYVCPSDLQGLHAQLQRRIDRMEMQKDLEKQLANIGKFEPSYAKALAPYKNLTLQSKGIIIRPLQSVMDVYKEGKAMHHCIYTCGYYKHNDTLLMSATDLKGNRLETIEFNTKSMRIMQSRGVCNKSTEWHTDIVKLINSNLQTIADCKTPKRTATKKQSTTTMVAVNA